MSDFSESIRRAYELYILGNKQEAFSMLIPGTKHHYYLSILDALKRERHCISKETSELIRQFKANFQDDDVTRIELQALFLKYDGAKSDDERNEILKDIDVNYVYGYYDHAKLADVKGKLDIESKADEKEVQALDLTNYFNEEGYLSRVYSNNYLISSLHKTLYNKIDFNNISENEFFGFLSNCESFATISNDTFWDKLMTTLDQKYKSNKHYSPDSYLYDKFTLDQLETLGGLVDQVKHDFNYIGKMFEKKFHFELDQENKDSFTLEQRREQLIAMYDASTDRPQSLKSALLLEILENGIKMDIFDKNYFIEYLKSPLKNWFMNKETQKKAEIYDYVWNQYISSVNNRKGGVMDSGLDKKLFKKYLEQFYIDSGDLTEFKEYFDQDFLADLFEEFEFMAGKEIKKEKIDAQKFEDLTNLVLINLLECNKDSFKKQDRVKLVAEIKNVSTLHVKIFEFNSENYYRKNLAPFRTDVNLDGLVTQHEEKFEFKELPQKKFRQVFEFPQLDDRVGLFVIEFISNGYSSRAVIKKGSLSLIYKSTVAGQVAYILDENKEICKTEATGMWYMNQYFKADPEKGGRILIPYEKNQTTDKTILIHDGFAQLTEFKRMSESYSFDVAYIVQSESLLMGKEAEILLKPCLKVNDRKCNLSILKNTKVTLITTSFIDNLPVTKVFENLEVNSKQEISIKFQVPPNLQSINLSIQAEVRNISKGTNDQLCHNHFINMDTKNYSLSFYECYLRKLKGKYYFYILGKNGEPLRDISVNFTLSHKIYNAQSETISISTDADGKVNLGPLVGIESLSTYFNGSNGECYSSYTIHNETEKVSLPDSMNILEDEEVQLPYISDHDFSQDSVSLVRFSSSYKVIENCFSKLSFNKDKGYQYGKITVSGLERGHYRLHFISTGTVVQIRVHKGVYWETDSFILKDHSLVEKREKTNIIRIKDVTLEEDKEQGNKLSFNIEDYGKNARAHIFAFTFLQQDVFSDYYNFERVGKDWTALDVFPFAKWENIFLSNRKLGDEFRYVFDRKFLKRFMGNTLDRPQLLLNRHKVRDTQFDQEVVNSGNQYDLVKEVERARYAPPPPPAAPLYQNCAPPAYSAISNMAPMMRQDYGLYDNMCQNIAPMAYAQNLDMECAFGNKNMYCGNYISPQSGYKSFQNFLNNAACVKSNLFPDEKGHVECCFDAYKYSTVMVLVVDDNTVSESVVDVLSALDKVEKRDLSLSNPLDPTKYYNEMRNSLVLRKGESHGIEDITSTNYIMIDSLERVAQVQKEVCKVNYNSTSDDLSFLIKWSGYTQEEKNKKYSQYVCHEVNLFLYFKDPEYFKSVVRPFIANKMEKSFIDLWLIGDHDSIVKHRTIEHFDRLNTLEKCLLISEVVKDDKTEAQALADIIKQSSDYYEISIDLKNRITDSVINLNMTQNQQPNIPASPVRQQYDGISGMNFDYQQNLLCDSIQNFGENRRLKGFRGGRGGMMNMMAMPQNRIKSKYIVDECCDDDFGYNYEEERKVTRTQFQEAEAATEYCETHYYKNQNIMNPSLFIENPFWVDLANHIVKSGSLNDFVSPNFIYATDGETQKVSVVSFLNLPFESPTQSLESLGDKGVKITASDNLVLYKKEIKEAPADLDTNILVIHRFFEENNRSSEKKIKEFLVNHVYGCETIITNVSATTQTFQILWQIPEGSLPLQNTNYQKSENKSLNPYSTTTFQYFFYFPRAGNFIQFPSNITIGDKVVAVANECKFEVVEERREISNETFRDILLSGNSQAVIDFLSTANLRKGDKGFSFYDILWMLKDKKFFKQVTDTLRSRRIYDDQVWKYGFYHKDPQTARESIMRNDYLISRTGTFFESSLIQCNPNICGFRHLDYFPMINARAHKLGDNTNSGILNIQFRDTYNKFLLVMSEKLKLNEADMLNMTYYLLLQDRITEAIDVFEKIDSKHFENGENLRMQYNYMRAYLDFFTGSETGFKLAKTISKQYADYPILAWKVLFTEILDQLEEFEEGVDYDEDINQLDETKKKANLKKSINLEPILHCELEGKSVKVEYNNIPKITVKYYVIDPEVLFSRAPFLNQNTEDFAYVKPMDIQEVELDKKLKSDTFNILDKLQKFNLVIEVTGEGKQTFLTYFSTSLKVVINENFGELKVTDQDDKPIAKVYVKAFSKENNGTIKFFKDGYTDIRGKFEYAQINSKKLSSVEKFAILVMSDDHGSITREAKAPVNVVKDLGVDISYLQPSYANKFAHQQNRKSNKAEILKKSAK